MQARSKPLTVVNAIGSSSSQSVNSYQSPLAKSACKMIDASSVEELVNLLQNEAKVI